MIYENFFITLPPFIELMLCVEAFISFITFAFHLNSNYVIMLQLCLLYFVLH